jgi:acetyl esterase/lipase
MAIQRPQPNAEIRFGTASAQGVDVFVPDGVGPHPVAILVHGGCWSVHTAGREQLRHLGADLSRRGIAVWSIGYRRANEASGGYPGTYEDVATAIDLLPSLGPAHRMDPSRSVLVGHSAGGHLALWAAARAGLPTNSPLKTRDPFLPPWVISLAGIGDVRGSAAAICGADIAQRLAAPTAPGAQVDAYADTSPADLPPPESHIVMVSALLDRLVAPALADEHVRAMHAKGKWSIDLIRIADAGHFDLVTPGTTAWGDVVRRIEAALARGHTRKTAQWFGPLAPQPHEVNTP